MLHNDVNSPFLDDFIIFRYCYMILFTVLLQPFDKMIRLFV